MAVVALIQERGGVHSSPLLRHEGVLRSSLRLMAVVVPVILAVSCTSGQPGLSPTLTAPPVTAPSATVPQTIPPSTTPPAHTAAPTNTPTATTPFNTTFDFDTGSPLLPAGRGTPLDQTSGGVTAHFDSPSDPAAFSVQNQGTTFLALPRFSGNYLSESKPFRHPLSIVFSRPITGITLTFATSDSHGPGNVEEPSDLRLTAYADSSQAAPVGSATARGTFLSESYPQGTLSFNSTGRQFSLVVIELLAQPRGGTDFLVDDITVTAS